MCSGGADRESGSVVRSVLSCFLLTCIVVAPVPSVCCSVKLPLSRPTSFCLFLSILLRTAAGGGAATWRFCCRWQPELKHQEQLLIFTKNHELYLDAIQQAELPSFRKQNESCICHFLLCYRQWEFLTNSIFLMDLVLLRSNMIQSDK